MRHLGIILLLSACNAPVEHSGRDTDRQISRELRPDAAASPESRLVTRAPTRDEAEQAGRECDVTIEYWSGLGRPPPEGVYQPVDATPAQRECPFDRIRHLVGTQDDVAPQ